jgi:L-rhamnose isomerase
MEEAKTLPFGPVWENYCSRHNLPSGEGWLSEIKTHEANVLSKRK